MTYEFCSVPSTGLSGNNYLLFRVKMRWFLKSKTFRRHRKLYLNIVLRLAECLLRSRPKTFCRLAELHSADQTERLTRMVLKPE